ncbi:MAG: DEAD/DEAH box helicase [Bacteroidetes bacterium]|nr:MAG: DEAD/DEAH box helicase [Bacteroidota bacterium]
MTTFQDLGLSQELIAAIEKLGFVHPTPIQEKAIPTLLNAERDFVGLASTGTGKTAAFGLPMLQSINPANRNTQGLIIAPTRELCLQIANDLKAFSSELPQIDVVAVYGGANITMQIKELRRGAQVIVATPGRLIDLIHRGAAQIHGVDYVVLDEADEMLNMGFQEDIDEILSSIQEERRIWLFSATMPAEVRRIASNYMFNPLEATVGTKNATNANIRHEVYSVRARDRYAALKRIIDFYPEIFGMVFTRTKIEAQDVAEKLMRDGYNADALHGDLSQVQRDKVMARFRDRSIQILVATDVAARGIDVDNITHVINFGIPDELEVYTHRSGRTARAGKTGTSISIIHSKDSGKVRQLEKISKAVFHKMEIPTGEEVCEKQLFSLVKKVHDVEVNQAEIEQYLPAVYNELNDLSKEELIQKFVSLEFNRFLSYYEGATDLNLREGERDTRGGDRSGKFDRFFVSLGELDDFDKQNMLRFINSLKLGRIEVGRIEIKRSFSFVEIETSMSEEFQEKVNAYVLDGRQLKAEPAGPRQGGGGGSYGGGSSDRKGGKRGDGRRSFEGKKDNKGYGKRRDGGKSEGKPFKKKKAFY